jgi:hypothetical protein
MKCEQILYLFLVASVPPNFQTESKSLPSAEFSAAGSTSDEYYCSGYDSSTKTVKNLDEEEELDLRGYS